MSKTPLHLFEGYGLELEYMIVDRETFEVRPIADWLLAPSRPPGYPRGRTGATVAGPTNWPCMSSNSRATARWRT